MHLQFLYAQCVLCRFLLMTTSEGRCLFSARLLVACLYRLSIQVFWHHLAWHWHFLAPFWRSALQVHMGLAEYGLGLLDSARQQCYCLTTAVCGGCACWTKGVSVFSSGLWLGAATALRYWRCGKLADDTYSGVSAVLCLHAFGRVCPLRSILVVPCAGYG